MAPTRAAVAAVVAAAVALLLSPEIVPKTQAAFSASAESTASTFATADSFCGSPAIAWMTGMEHGSTSVAGGGLWGSQALQNGSQAVADSTVTRSGSYSLRVDKVGGDSDSAGLIRRDIASSATVLVARFAIRFNTLPESDVVVGAMGHLTGNWVQLGYTAGGQRLRIRFANGTWTEAAGSIAAGRWHVIDARASFGADPRTVDWRVNGVDQAPASSSEAAASPDTVWLSAGSGVSADAFTAFYDDMLTSVDPDAYPLPDGRIHSLVPNEVPAGGISNPGEVLKNGDGTAVDSGSWLRLRETPMTSTATWIAQTAADPDAHLTLGFDDVTRTGCINAVSGLVAYRSSSTDANLAKTSIVTDGAERVVYAGAMNPGGTLTYRSAVIAPGTGAWNADELTAATARIGHASDTGSHPYWDALRLEYDQTPNLAGAYEDEVLADSPAGYWRLGETSGTTAVARTGGPDGAYTNGPTLNVGGAVGDTDPAVHLDGVDDHVTFGDVHGFPGTAPFTVELWMRRNTLNEDAFRPLVTKEEFYDWYPDEDRHGWGLWLVRETDPDAARRNRLTFERWQGATNNIFTSTTRILPNTWYHVAATYDGSTARIYVNGDLEVSGSSTLALNAHSAPLRLGRHLMFPLFPGALDELAIYDYSLSAERIQAHYEAGRR